MVLSIAQCWGHVSWARLAPDAPFRCRYAQPVPPASQAVVRVVPYLTSQLR